MKVAIFSDLHLGIKNDSPEWHNIAFEWLETMIEELNHQGINKIFFLGDFFHNRNTISVATLHSSTNFLDKMKNFELYIFSGNHDLYYANDNTVSSVSMFKRYDNIHYIEDITIVDIDGVEITLCPWGCNPIESNLKSTEFLFGHFEINTFLMNSSNIMCEDGYKLSDLLKKYKNIYSGHFHKAQNRQYSTGMVQYVGSPFQQNFGEADDEKGFIILDLEKNEQFFIENKISPKFVKIKLSQMLKMKFDKIEKYLKNNFVKIFIDKNITTDDLEEFKKLVFTCAPRSPFNVEWDSSEISTNNNSNDFISVDLLQTLIEFTNLLEIENTVKSDTITYLTNKYKQKIDN